MGWWRNRLGGPAIVYVDDDRIRPFRSVVRPEAILQAPSTKDMCYGHRVRQSWRDAIKSILLPVAQNEQMPSAFETARLAASIFDSVIEGVALDSEHSEIIAADAMIAVSVQSDGGEAELSRRARAAFDTYIERSTDPNAGARFRWRERSSIRDATLGSLARVYDLTVLNRPWARGAGIRALRKRPAGVDGSTVTPEVARPDGCDPLERQHGGESGHRHGDAHPMQSTARDVAQR